MADENNQQQNNQENLENGNGIPKDFDKIKNVVIETELKQAYLDYSMSVIVGRALPDVRDGLKPVHRRILFSFWENGWKSNTKFVKSAKLVGAVIGNYHPHGDAAVYDAMVRMTQDFSLRYPLVKGQGNFGCFTADTCVKLTDGRDLSFVELIEEDKKGKRNFTFTTDENNKIKVAEIKNPRLTKKDAEIMKVILDNGEEIKCTLNHKFMLKNGNYKEAKDLKSGDSLKSFTNESKKGFIKKECYKIKSIKSLNKKSDVYDLTIDKTHNFSLSAGVFVHNSLDGDSAASYRYCLTGDALILTDKGIMPISKISNKEESNIKLSILNYEGEEKNATKFFNSGKHPVIEIKTHLEYCLKGTYNHPVLCWTLNKFGVPSIQWKLLEDIHKGDYVILSRKSLFNKNEVDLKSYFPQFNKRHKSILLPEKLNKELAFILGAFVSEGSFHQGQILFCNKDIEFYSTVKEYLKRQFINISIYENILKDGSYQLAIFNQAVVKFLENIGLFRAKSDFKEIPFSILLGKKEIVKEFLKALFEGDGSVLINSCSKNGGKSIQLCYDSKSEKLLKQLKVLLLNFGISSLNPYLDKRNGCCKLVISSFENINRFNKQIGFFSERNNRVLGAVKSLNSLRMSHVDFIPYLSAYLRKNYKNQFILKNNFDRYNNLEKNYDKLNNILNNHDKKLINWLRDNNYLFDKVEEILRLKDEEIVYSVKVDSNCHSFVANGFINHNTEAKLSKISEEMLQDIDKETVLMTPSFDGTMQEPSVLPSRLPNLLINGTSGIAVGMATNIPPHNISEVCSAVIAVIDNPEISIQELMNHIKGPDFPTAGIICGTSGIYDAYSTGRGKITVRAKTECSEKKIYIYEIPYQVNKALLIENIADLVKDKKIEGISNIRDESDKDGLGIAIDVKQGFNSEIVLNNLFKYTQLETTFGCIFIAIVNNEPRVLSLKDILFEFVKHRKDVIIKRTVFDLRKAEERAHILEGLKIALANIDDAVRVVKSSKDAEVARGGLMSKFGLTEVQSQAILDMKLQKLTGLETQKLIDELTELGVSIADFKDILANNVRVLNMIKADMNYLKESYGDNRRTEIQSGFEETINEDLIKREKLVITVSHAGYVKRIPLETYKSQRRGGKGIVASGVKDEDYVEHLFVTDSHAMVLFFSNLGKVYWMKGYEIPEGTRYSKGTAIVNLLSLGEGEKIRAMIPVEEFVEGKYLVLCTAKGIVKKTALLEYARPRNGGVIAINLRDDDNLVNAVMTSGGEQLILATRDGRAARFKESDVREVGRNSIGVRGINIKNSEVVGMEICNAPYILTVTDKGYGKRSSVNDYRLINRGGSGVINIKSTEKNGKVVGIKVVSDEQDVMFITKLGVLIRTPCSGISVVGRNSQGVRLMRLDESDAVIALTTVVSEDEDIEAVKDDFKPSEEAVPSENDDSTDEVSMGDGAEA